MRDRGLNGGGRRSITAGVKRFSFKLETVRALREQVEQVAREELARELSLSALRRAELTDAEARLDSARTAGALLPGAVAGGGELVARQAFVERRERELRAVSIEADLQEDEVERRRVRLEQAAQERESIERLRRREAVRHERELARAEEAQLDELALARHRRRSVLGGSAA